MEKKVNNNHKKDNTKYINFDNNNKLSKNII